MTFFQETSLCCNDERAKLISKTICLFTPEIRQFFESNPSLCADVSEIRLRVYAPSSVTVRGRNQIITGKNAQAIILCAEELDTVFARLCNGSVYTQSETLKMGFAVRDCLRIGVGGRVNVRDGKVIGFSGISSLNIRIPVFAENAADGMLSYLASHGFEKTGGILAISPPGGGKTTFLRAFARALSGGTLYLGGKRMFRVCLADERGELYNETFFKGCIADRLEMCPKGFAVECATALLSPEVIVCDEIRSEAEADALAKAYSYGIILVASCHGSGAEDVLKRPHMRRLVESGAFGTACCIRYNDGVFTTQINPIMEMRS